MNEQQLNGAASTAPIIGGKPRPEVEMMPFVEMHLNAIRSLLPVFNITLVVSDPQDRKNSFVALGDEIEPVLNVLQNTLARQRAAHAQQQSAIVAND